MGTGNQRNQCNKSVSYLDERRESFVCLIFNVLLLRRKKVGCGNPCLCWPYPVNCIGQNQSIKKPQSVTTRAFTFRLSGNNYIMPPMPPPIPPGAAGAFSSGSSATTHSVVSSRAAIEAAFSRARRVTLVGSMIPCSIRFS